MDRKNVSKVEIAVSQEGIQTPENRDCFHHTSITLWFSHSSERHQAMRKSLIFSNSFGLENR